MRIGRIDVLHVIESTCACQITLRGRLHVIVRLCALILILDHLIAVVILIVGISDHSHALLHLAEIFVTQICYIWHLATTSLELCLITLTIVETQVNPCHLIPISMRVLLTHIHVLSCSSLLVDHFRLLHVFL